MWGDNGYFKLARKGNDCGITIGGVLAVIDKEAAAKAATPEVCHIEWLQDCRVPGIRSCPISDLLLPTLCVVTSCRAWLQPKLHGRELSPWPDQLMALC
jgi:hypothetical protein